MRLCLKLCVAALLACTEAVAAQQQVLDVPGGKIRVGTVATGLFHSWRLAFMPDGAVVVAERDGSLRIIRDDVLAPDPVWTSPTPRGQAADSIHGITLHPQSAQNRVLYGRFP